MRLFGFLMGLALVGAVIFTLWQGRPDHDGSGSPLAGLAVLPRISVFGPPHLEAGSASGGAAVSPTVRPVPEPAAELPVEGAAADPPVREPESGQPSSGDPRMAAVAGPDPVAVEADAAGQEPLPVAIAEPSMGPDEHWEAFFTPFRSEASALGFAGFLQRTTGREFVVRRAGPGDYRVWFRLAAGESRPERLAEIEEATGMALAGGQF